MNLTAIEMTFSVAPRLWLGGITRYEVDVSTGPSQIYDFDEWPGVEGVIFVAAKLHRSLVAAWMAEVRENQCCSW